ncbi:hypothetical protein [Mesorhizobium sp. B4-1-4]|uniref:hypothetical protein n=1 Tax=Mesorhizobium sp. B4-1-4 TaxID=2589888 RepID=UPI00112DFDB2|nr:hypothetical protein [Mesorhizobium sp. B4-1-4]UCI32032.1 hypothetical protein FJW03_00760 [Mesorhizobium sp. B4-1-4]
MTGSHWSIGILGRFEIGSAALKAGELVVKSAISGETLARLASSLVQFSGYRLVVKRGARIGLRQFDHL